jgi:hypothetical protein
MSSLCGEYRERNFKEMIIACLIEHLEYLSIN